MNTPHSSADFSLPAPDAAAAEHSAALVRHIRDAIAEAGGWLPFSRYMELALYAPALGYYSSGARNFGEAGDFVTAPEISPLFSNCLATQIAEVLETLGQGEVLEVGAGTGVMAADVLLTLDRLGALPKRYSILEVSADLKQRQAATLGKRCPGLANRVTWLDRPPVSGFCGVVVGNEVLDALPVDCFEIAADGVLARGVVWRANAFEWATRPAAAPLESAVRHIEAHLAQPMTDGYQGEVCTSLAAWLQTIIGGLQAGAALFIDYGLPRGQLYLPERRAGSLACHYRHRFHDDPFLLPGLNDITAWVDFSAVAEAASELGLEHAGFTTQAHFLFASDLEHHMQAALASQPATAPQMRLAGEVRQLTLPGEMGERFKVIGMTRNYAAPLRGFGLRELAL